ncbi:DUF4232 domain-containing protein [Mycobacterium alsense]|uniref:DUF4232 domain-containing protein n=1 Tax=Mycobacterium alsense TaxID=324058 RepID=A0AA42C3F7_9MYCO|nr:DUF4232 domain-containing protein [Mycobacterium alsense]MCV7382152.1 DUF4232 domain-containing protein [Mycobacterium alsense]
MPGSYGRRVRRLVASLCVGCAAVVVPGPPAWAAPADTVDQPPPCWSEQIAVSASQTQGAAGHRGLTLVFALAGGAEPCTLSGYPGVDSGNGGPPIHARPTPRGYMGGLPAGVEEPPTVTLSLSTQGQAVVEGLATDADGHQCPNYTDLAVTPPNIVQVYTVPATIDACRLEVHPVTAG